MGRPKQSNDKTRILISFTEYDEDVYDYLKSLKNASAYVKHLVRANMQEGGVITPISPAISTPKHKNNNPIHSNHRLELKDEIEDRVTLDKNNLNKLQDLEL